MTGTDEITELWPEVRASAFLLFPGAVLVWLVMCGVGYLLTHPLTNAGFTGWEVGVDRWFAHHRTSSWNSVTNFASLAGDTPAAIGISVVAFIVLRLVVGRWREPILLAVSMVGEVGIFSGTVAVVGRHRPTVQTPGRLAAHLEFPLRAHGGLDHPVRRARRRGVRVREPGRAAGLAVVVAAVIVLSIGASRLYRGMHYPSDIAGGILLGLLWVTVTALFVLHGRAGHD